MLYVIYIMIVIQLLQIGSQQHLVIYGNKKTASIQTICMETTVMLIICIRDKKIGKTRFELATPTSRTWCSTKLSYFPRKSSLTHKSCQSNREDRIRTCDPLVPNQVLYQAELLPENCLQLLISNKNAPSRSRTYNLLIRSQTLYPIALWVHNYYSIKCRGPGSNRYGHH